MTQSNQDGTGPKHEDFVQDKNKRLVLAMWEGVIRQADPAAVMRYIGPDYIQHNVNMTSGRASVLRLVEIIRNPPPGFVAPGHKTVVKVVAEDDLVVVIWNQPQPDPHRPGETYIGQAFDMFRIEGDLIVEHWDDTRKSAQPWR